MVPQRWLLCHPRGLSLRIGRAFGSTPRDVPQAALIDHDLDSLILFPGQGTQHVGMGRRLLDYPDVKDLFESASEVLRYNLLKLCCEGPQEKLDKTIFAQPAVFVTSIAAAFKLKEERPKAIEQCVGAAGFSVGEISALVFAGAMSFEEGLHLVRVRAEAMQRCCDDVESGMLTLLLDNRSVKTHDLLTSARSYCINKLNITNPVVAVASYLYPGCRVIAGHKQALDFIRLHGAEFGVRRAVPVRVSGAFHTDLMGAAIPTVRHCVERMHLQRPLIPVYSNVDADFHMDRKAIAGKITQQIVRPVRWEQCLIRMLQRPTGVPVPRTYEVGPGDHLTKMLRRMNLKAWHRSSVVSV